MEITGEEIILNRFNKLVKEYKAGDYSSGTFPRTTEECRIEVEAKIECLQWVIEMLDIKA